MLYDLTRLARNPLEPPKIVKDESLAGRHYGVMVKDRDEIFVSPTVYGLLFTPDGRKTPEHDSVAKALEVRIVKRGRKTGERFQH